MISAGVSPQHVMETTAIYFTVIRPNTMMSFWNMRMASAPIQQTEDMVKYWIVREKKVQAPLFSVRSMPTRKNRSMQKMAMQS